MVGLPDARLAEVGVAFVRLEPGAALTEDEVIDHCRGQIASFKIPRRVIFVDEFPMTSSGKIQKVETPRRSPPPCRRPKRPLRASVTASRGPLSVRWPGRASAFGAPALAGGR